ncbi:MAG: T9SS type A sorting domain-containing protein [Bacteroidetes bacterium]|nr:T9SS type A sorting domain-containing protein [Bacteroidota bacterium]
MGETGSILKTTTGDYEVDFINDTFPDGIYYYRLKAGDQSITWKMVLLK